MSRKCLFEEQTARWRDVYIVHYVGLAWMISHWVIDLFSLFFWVRQASGKQVRMRTETSIPLVFIYFKCSGLDVHALGDRSLLDALFGP